MSLQAYRPILATPGLRSLFAAATLARLPVGFETLGIVLLLRDEAGSFAIAGLAVGLAFAVSAAASAPLGRLCDRLGQRRVLIPAAAWNAGAVSGLATAGLVDAPSWVLLVLSAATGVIPPISACQRAIIADHFRESGTQAVFALESIIQEAVFTLGPLIGTIAATLAGPPAALFTSAVLVLGGTLWFSETRLSRQWRGADVTRRGRSALGSPAVRLLFVVALLWATSVGSFEVGITALSRAEGSPNLAGLFLALWAIGSAVGGLWLGSRAAGRDRETRMAILGLASGIALAPAAAAGNLWMLAPAMLIAGFFIAPFLSLLYSLTGDRAPDGMTTEAFSWLNVGFPIGIALGAAAAGPIADGAGPRVAIIVAGAGAVLSGLVTFRWRRTLRPQPTRA